MICYYVYLTFLLAEQIYVQYKRWTGTSISIGMACHGIDEGYLEHHEHEEKVGWSAALACVKSGSI
jgi:hypothetical protein